MIYISHIIIVIGYGETIVCLTSLTLVQHCTNVIQMFCVYWLTLKALIYIYINT